MFNVEELEAKGTSNGCVVQLFKHDRSGQRAYHSEVLSYSNAELWPYAFVERIDHLLESGDVGVVYSMDTQGVWFALVLMTRPGI